MVAINNISDCKRVVIKIGSSLVTGNSNDIDKKFLDSISSDIQNLHKQNKEVILVSSGAVALGNRNKSKKKLNNKNSKQSIFYQNLGKLLEIKRKQKAFHPNAKRLNINLGSKIFCYERISLDKKQTIICITNLSTKLQYIKINKNLIKYRDLLGRKIFFTLDKKIKLDPCQTIWLSNR